MTEMVYGAAPAPVVDPILPRWWRTIDRWTLSCILCLFGIGLLLGFAASPPLAAENGLEPFYYVIRQAAFGGLALIAMFITSMMPPVLVRRLAVLGVVIAAAMVINIVTASLAGVLVPVAFERVGQDPAVASSVFVTMITDSMGFFAFLGLAVAVGLVG